MQWWYYRGQVTTPIDIPGKGPTVLRPRDKFQAPFGAVAHLKRLGRVVPCKPPPEAKKEKAKPKVEPKSKPTPPKGAEERAVAAPTVVASSAEPKAEVKETKKVEATVEVADEAPKTPESQENPKEKEKGTRRRRNKS